MFLKLLYWVHLEKGFYLECCFSAKPYHLFSPWFLLTILTVSWQTISTNKKLNTTSKETKILITELFDRSIISSGKRELACDPDSHATKNFKLMAQNVYHLWKSEKTLPETSEYFTGTGRNSNPCVEYVMKYCLQAWSQIG